MPADRETDRLTVQAFGYDPDTLLSRLADAMRVSRWEITRRTRWLAADEDLTDKERAALLCLSHGLSPKQTAGVLLIGHETVKSRTKQARRKLFARSTLHACCEAIRRGLIP